MSVVTISVKGDPKLCKIVSEHVASYLSVHCEVDLKGHEVENLRDHMDAFEEAANNGLQVKIITSKVLA